MWTGGQGSLLVAAALWRRDCALTHSRGTDMPAGKSTQQTVLQHAPAVETRPSLAPSTRARSHGARLEWCLHGRMRGPPPRPYEQSGAAGHARQVHARTRWWQQTAAVLSTQLQQPVLHQPLELTCAHTAPPPPHSRGHRVATLETGPPHWQAAQSPPARWRRLERPPQSRGCAGLPTAPAAAPAAAPRAAGW